MGWGIGERRLLQNRVKIKGIQSTPDNSNLQGKKKKLELSRVKLYRK